MMRKISLVFLLLTCMLGCNDEAEDSIKIEPKYALRDCLVRVDFAWNEKVDSAEKEEVIENIVDAIREATIVTRKLPMFFGHTAGDRSYFVFYFTDKCENRGAMTKRFIEEFLSGRSKNFPEYSIVSQGIEPGFDGVMPSGAWKSDRG